MISLGAVLLVVFASTATSAFAFQTHTLQFKFNAGDAPSGTQTPLTNPIGLALDDSDGSVYTSDELHIVDKFNAVGAYISQNLGSATVNGSFAGYLSPFALAVDQSNGDLYVADNAHGVVDKFNAAGQLIAGFGNGGQIDGHESNTNHFPLFNFAVNGLAVDPVTHDLFANNSSSSSVVVYDSSGVFLRQFTVGVESGGLAIDSAGHLYVLSSGGAYVYDTSGNIDPAYGGGSGQLHSGPSTAIAVDPVSNDVYVADGGHIVEYDSSGSQIDDFGSGVLSYTFGLNAIGNKVYAGDYYNSYVKVFTPAIVPDAVTGSTSALTPTGVNLAGHVDPAGGGNVSGCIFEYIDDPTFQAYGGYAGAPSSTMPCNPAAPYSAPTDVSAGLGSLQPATTYHYRVLATDAQGTRAGNDQTFSTPPAVAGVSTAAATGVQQNSATLSGAFDPAGIDTHYYFEYGVDTSYGQTSSAPPGADAGAAAGNTPVSDVVSGLTAETTYHFRIAASNSFGTTFGQDREFTTPIAVEGVSSGAPSDVGWDSATLHGSLDPHGHDTHYYFEYGTDPSYGQTNPAPPGADAGSGTGATQVTTALSGLQQMTEYHYRIVATNAFGKTVGGDQSFTTLGAPSVDDQSTSGLTETAATLKAQIKPNGVATTYHFEYGTSAAYGQSTPESASIGSDTLDHPASADISGLATATAYHFRVVATSLAGTTKGSDQTFTTVPYLPTVGSTSSSGVTSTTATLSGEINPGLALTAYNFEYGPTPFYGSVLPSAHQLEADESDHPVSTTIFGLIPGTTYHFRITAINFAGSSSSPDQTFTTTDLPRVIATSSSAITQVGATLNAQVRPNQAPTTVHFEYGTSAAYGQSTPESASIGSDTLDHPASTGISGLAPATTYHFRVVATNPVGGVSGPDQVFTTAAEPVLIGPKPAICKKGQVKRNGKCVKRKRRSGKHHPNRRHG